MRLWSHISEKVFEGTLPAAANANPASAVVLVLRGPWITTPFPHVLPASVLDCGLSLSGMAMRDAGFGSVDAPRMIQDFGAATATTARMVVAKMVTVYRDFIATFAAAQPSTLPMSIVFGAGQHAKFAEGAA